MYISAKHSIVIFLTFETGKKKKKADISAFDAHICMGLKYLILF